MPGRCRGFPLHYCHLLPLSQQYQPRLLIKPPLQQQPPCWAFLLAPAGANPAGLYCSGLLCTVVHRRSFVQHACNLQQTAATEPGLCSVWHRGFVHKGLPNKQYPLLVLLIVVFWAGQLHVVLRHTSNRGPCKMRRAEELVHALGCSAQDIVHGIVLRCLDVSRPCIVIGFHARVYEGDNFCTVLKPPATQPQLCP